MQSFLKYFKGLRLYHLRWQHIQCWITLFVKKFLLMWDLTMPRHSLCTLILLRAAWKERATLTWLQPPFGCLLRIIRFSVSPFPPGWTTPFYVESILLREAELLWLLLMRRQGSDGPCITEPHMHTLQKWKCTFLEILSVGKCND